MATLNLQWQGIIVMFHSSHTVTGKFGGVVRIMNRTTAERTLLKDFVGRVTDLAFAHTDDVILAVVDEIGNLCVYEIKESFTHKIEYPFKNDMEEMVLKPNQTRLGFDYIQ